MSNEIEGAMPPLPASVGCIEYPGSEYEQPWVSSMDAYDEDQMHAYAKAYAAPLIARVAELQAALHIAEAALSDIGDADREPGDDLAWCEARAAEAIPQARAALKGLT